MEQLFVIKIGGNIINNDRALDAFLADFSQIKEKKILVHGGGKKATEIGERLGIPSRYVDGRRITDRETISLVTMVYGGLLNKEIVAKLQGLKNNAIGLTGADANSIPALKRPVKEIDYGFVGDLKEQYDTHFIRLCLSENLVPVFPALTHDGKGQMLNTNADTIASSLAVMLSRYFKVRLIYCFEKKGVLKHLENNEEVVPLIDFKIFEKMRAENRLSDGILPKIQNSLEAVRKGVNSVLIGHAEDLIQNTTDQVSGTLIKA